MKNLTDLLNDYKKFSNDFMDLYNKAPYYVGEIALKHIQGNFDNQGFDNGKEKWVEWSDATKNFYNKRKLGTKGTVTMANKKKGAKILYQTGDLYDSIDFEVNGHTAWVGIDKNMSDIIKYAKIHNEGGHFKMFGKWDKIMPRRKFLGWSKDLQTKVRTSIISRINILMKKHNL
jgi:phage gpG-like protein